jgi:hypothetical protein
MQTDMSSPLCPYCMLSVHKYILQSHITTLTTYSFTMLSKMYSMEMRAAKISSVKRVNSFTKTLPSKQTTTRPIIPSQRPIYTRTVRKSSPFVKQNWKKNAQRNFNFNIYKYIIYTSKIMYLKSAVKFEKQQFMSSPCPTRGTTIKCWVFHKQWFSPYPSNGVSLRFPCWWSRLVCWRSRV